MAENPNSENGLHTRIKFDGYNASFGVCNRSNQQSTYINLGLWVKQLTKGDIGRDTFRLECFIKRELYRLSAEYFDNVLSDRTICIIDGTTSDRYLHISQPQSTFIGIEIMLVFDGQIDIRDKVMKKRHQMMIEALITSIQTNKWFMTSPIRIKKTLKLNTAKYV